MGKVRRGTITSGLGKKKHRATRGWDFGKDGDWRSVFQFEQKTWISYRENNWPGNFHRTRPGSL